VRELLDTGGVTPGPVQQPFPIWFGFQGPQGARRAGRQGAGLLCLDPAVLEPYRAGLVEGGHDPAIARTGGVIDLIVTDDPERDAPRIRPHYAYQQASYRNAHGGATNAETIDVEVTLDGNGGGLAVVTPDDAIATIRRRAGDGPVEHVYLWLSMAGMDDDIVERHIELLGTVVGPALK
jgi:alkanesulfonate monooxygenase SsuD/methylene tetrahydromethanopterin reductase-like flavin-dependent oxidoreductase (luciferase family)